MPKKKDWGASTRSSARLASKELSEEPEREATATDIVKEEDDLCPGAFPNDEHRVAALSSTEIADDSLIDESSLLREQSETDVDSQFAVDAQLMASTEEMVNQETPQWARQLMEQVSELRLRVNNITSAAPGSERHETPATRASTPRPRVSSSERQESPATSALGGTGIKSTGFASSRNLDPYGDSQDAENPKFDSKARETRSLPEVFEGKKEDFEGWI
ncbi:hypothetical protein E4U50_007322, partial [Claviceps purpurea]